MKTKKYEFENDYHFDSFMEYVRTSPATYEVTDFLEVTVSATPSVLKKLTALYELILTDED